MSPPTMHSAPEGLLCSRPRKVAIVGGGPSGLLAAQRLSRAGVKVEIYEQKPSVGLKFLVAGRGGLNLTHSEPFDRFKARYGGTVAVAPFLDKFGPDEMRGWAGDLGVETFTGTSRRVFPKPPLLDKAAPVLRQWLAQLKEYGVVIHTNHTWIGFESASGRCPPPLRMRRPDGQIAFVETDAVLLALGGASWPRMGSDGRWVPVLASAGVPLAKLKPNNVGFQVHWTPEYREQYAGIPIKNVCLKFQGNESTGELMITEYGIEGSAVCALSSLLRDSQVESHYPPVLQVDLKPSMAVDELSARLARPSLRKASLSNKLRKAARLPPVAAGLLRHATQNDTTKLRDSSVLASIIKGVPLELGPHQGWEDAISTSGGVSGEAFSGNADLSSCSPSLMLDAVPGVFVAGEMLDWDAPTGGYLLTGCFSTANGAADQMIQWMS